VAEKIIERKNMRESKRIEKFYELAVEKVMERKGLPLIEKDATIDRVLSTLTKKTHVWVTESKGSRKVIGAITEHDILSILAPGGPRYVFGIPDMRTLHRGTAGSIMHRRLIRCGPKTTIREALRIMFEHGVRRLPVTKKGDIIVGEIRLHHIIKRFILHR
jgi:predicted transcriptional regulator